MSTMLNIFLPKYVEIKLFNNRLVSILGPFWKNDTKSNI